MPATIRSRAHRRPWRVGKPIASCASNDVASLSESLNDLHRGFRDDQQTIRAIAVVEQRLADDRDQEECRRLMRFSWQLRTELPQIDEHKLMAALGDTKLQAVRALINALRSSPAAVDRWIETTTTTFPVVHDRGWTDDNPSDVEPPRQRTPAIEPQGRAFLVTAATEAARPGRSTRSNDEELARAQAACRAGQEGAAMRLGEALEGRGDLPNAEAAYRLAGEAGAPAAYYALGRLLLARGEPEYRVAAAWQHAADTGVPEAMYALAITENESIGRSDRYLRQAAGTGHAAACYTLGYRAFQKGRDEEAAKWWKQAADQGLQIAAEALENLRMRPARDAE